MSADNIPDLPGLEADSLYRQEAITDLKVGSIQVLTPIKVDGSADESREKRFIGSTSILTPQGSLPVQSDIDAKTLEEAVQKFPAAMKSGVERMVNEAREMEREMRNGIVVPKGPVDTSGGPGQGGKPGGGLIV